MDILGTSFIVQARFQQLKACLVLHIKQSSVNELNDSIRADAGESQRPSVAFRAVCLQPAGMGLFRTTLISLAHAAPQYLPPKTTTRHRRPQIYSLRHPNEFEPVRKAQGILHTDNIMAGFDQSSQAISQARQDTQERARQDDQQDRAALAQRQQRHLDPARHPTDWTARRLA